MIEGLRDGSIDVIATDHAPHHADEKALEFDRAPSASSDWRRRYRSASIGSCTRASSACRASSS
jgi:hypothetical protein